MFSDRDFEIKPQMCFGWETLSADLELNHLLKAMSRGDEIIKDACQAALFCPLTEKEEILYRQAAVNDALRNPEAVRKLYEIIADTFIHKKKTWSWLSNSYLSSTFSSAVNLLKIYTKTLMDFRSIADDGISKFSSEAFSTLFTMLQQELTDDYLEEIKTHLYELNQHDGTLISVGLGDWNQGVDYILRRKTRKNFWLRWTFAPSFSIAPRDDSGLIDLGKRRDRAINEVTNALAQAAEHLESFFTLLQRELAFYVGCINLCDTLKTLNMPICFPNIMQIECEDRTWAGLYDVSLALIKKDSVVGNELSSEGKRVYIITGANQGGKSTFLRSVGQSQLMAQCGMFVAANQMSVPIRLGIFSHFKKEEDAAMRSGKLDEELARMDEIAEHLDEGSMVLFNESFAATNEREGSEICRQITMALHDNAIEVFSVTHLYTYATAFLRIDGVQYLKAQRLDTGARSFRIVPGEPEKTAFGDDLYKMVFK